MNKKQTLSLLLRGGAILTGSIGTALYLGSRFSGLLFLIAAGFFRLAEQARESGWKSVVSFVKRSFGKMGYPAAGIGLAVLIGGLLMGLTGYRPWASYEAMLYGGLIKNWHISVLNAVPLIFTGLSISLAFKGGLFNIGAEGQYYVGTMMATWLGIRLNMPALAVIPLIYLLGGAAGAAYNIIPAWLKVKTGAHEVVTTMMFAYIARTLSSLFIRLNGGDPTASKHAYITDAVRESSWLLRFKSFMPDANYRLHIGILIAVLTALLVQHVLFRTRLGFEIRAVGLNSQAARAQGIPVGRIIMVTMLLSGGLAAFSGVTQVLGLDHKMFENLNAGYGWNGIAVALLADTSPVGVIFSALLWGILDAGGQYMARTIQTPTSIVEIIKGLILFLILARHLFAYFRRKKA
jgi:general nucleoside transport system permease protein